MSSQTALGQVFLRLCESVDTPVSLGLWLRFKHSQKELLEVKLDPRHYTDSDSFASDYMLVNCVRKYKGLETGVDTAEVAHLKFIASEEQCLLTNRRIRTSGSLFGGRVEGIIHSAQRKISRILGPFNLKKVLHQCEWTQGATLEIPRRKSFADTKLTQLPITVTRRAINHFAREIEHDGRWFEAISGTFPEGPFCFLRSGFQIVDGNRVTTVPKDSSTDRVIAVEPRGNIFLQKGVGNFLRRRLARFGIDLSKQEVNQAWAAEALALDLATIDLSSASDTIALELVYLLLPIDWAVYLDDIRSPYGRLPDGSTIKYEKFSSMGNGFTFELESLIFFALSEAIQETSDRTDWRLTSVYGDDIIAPQSYYPEIAEWFDWFGFTVNNRKSYSSGQFFESCGKHYFGGVDVTPVYQKELLDEVEAMRLGNRLQRWALRTSRFDVVRTGWRELRRYYTLLSDCYLPLDAEGDDGWLQPVRENWLRSPNHGVKCRVIRFTKKSLPFDDKAMLAYSLRKLAWRSNSLYKGPWGTASTLAEILSNRLGYIEVDLGEEQREFEVESARFTYGWRWVHTSEVVRPEKTYKV